MTEMALPAGPVPFDSFNRYRACAEILAPLAEDGASILDAGSGAECLLAAFLPKCSVTFLDPLLPPGEGEGSRIGGDVRSPALDGRSFDFVTAVDVLEHVPPGDREPFLRRLSSLAARGLLLAFPDGDGGEAERTDRFVGEAYRAATGSDYPWLAEHRENGLPSGGGTEAFLASLGWKVRSRGHGNGAFLREVLPFLLASLETEALLPALDALSRHLDAEVAPRDFAPPCYRRIVLATREELPEGAWPGEGGGAPVSPGARERLWAIAAAVPAAAAGLERRVRALEAELREARGEIDTLTGSRSWRITKPLRDATAAWRRLRG